MVVSTITVIVTALLSLTTAQLVPSFLPGGDMINFSIREDAVPGTVVYTLRGADPLDRTLSYSASGDYLSVDSVTGVVRLVKKLDREQKGVIDTILTVTAEDANGSPVIVPVRREVRVEDINDNAPQFVNGPYSFRVAESSPVGATLFSDITVMDLDEGKNAAVTINCNEQKSGDGCSVFTVRTVATRGGAMAVVSLREELDYEHTQSYTLHVVAIDGGENGGLSSTSVITVNVEDVQDTPPVFLNSPYSATVREGVEESHKLLQGTRVLRMRVKDGDLGSSRPLLLSIEDDPRGYFAISDLTVDEEGVTSASLVTSSTLLDREDPTIVSNGGIYTFTVTAREKGSNDVTSVPVTIVVTDTDDMLPQFSREEVTVSVPEDLANGTPLSGLDLFVSDGDLGDNAVFTLTLDTLSPPQSEGVFTVFPKSVVGRSPVILKMADASRVDFEDEQRTNFVLRVNAVQNGNAVASCLINIKVTDANDNKPAFESNSYRASVSESTPSGSSITTITATDRDSASFGTIRYSIKGFGSEKFRVNPLTGEISLSSCSGVEHCLDYERQRSYSLTFIATDGGGKVVSVNLFIDVLDENDNSPVFSQLIYRRTVDEGATDFVPPLMVEATDVDGEQQGGGKVLYSLQEGNTEDSAFSIDSETGEIAVRRPLTYLDTPTSTYTLTVRASDEGSPVRYSDVTVSIKVGRQTNKAPRFLQKTYTAVVPETASPGVVVETPEAIDPDGNPVLGDIAYYQLGTGAGDMFVIQPSTGVISLGSNANLDRDDISIYTMEILAVDRDKVAPQTATAVLTVTIGDVNNKAPTFKTKTYTSHISERLPVGEYVLQVSARDTDDDADLLYTFDGPVTARDRTGISLTEKSSYDYTSAFTINSTTGVIAVGAPLNHNEAAVMILKIKVSDQNASEVMPIQEDFAEVTIYIQAFSDKNPIFGPPWTPSHPYLNMTLKEEEPLDKPVFAVPATDPVTGQPIRRYEKVAGSDLDDIFVVAPITGQVSLTKRLDFETYEFEVVSLRVKAIAGDRFSEATVTVTLQDINDNSPEFTEPEYVARISEDSEWPSSVLSVMATDDDTGEYGKVTYSLSGNAEMLFVINDTTGEIFVARGAQLDREKESMLSLEVTATDTPGGGLTSRWSVAKVTIELLDVNDEAPEWSQTSYTAVVPENADIGMAVTQIIAQDPDEGLNGIVRYVLPENQVPLDGLFSLDTETGILSVTRTLRGKGRGEPYDLAVRAMDQGSPQKFSEAIIKLYIGDVSSNDGVPKFIRPRPNEVATIFENLKVGSTVFQVQAKDPDDPNSANGRIVYSFLDNTANNGLFSINSQTGIISTQTVLDREHLSEYSVVVMAQDLGRPPQLTSRVLKINVTDVDDNDPIFDRSQRDVIFSIEEESSMGEVIGEVSAMDRDEGDNAMIDYAITFGNDEGLVEIVRTENNTAQLLVRRRIDREKIPSLTLTIACGKYGSRLPSRMEYKPNNPNLLEVKIVIQDLDDNRPEFESQDYSAGIQVDSPLQTEIITVKAVDLDPTSPDIKYSLADVSFQHASNSYVFIPDIDMDVSKVFLLEEHSGKLLSHASLIRYTQGHFKVNISATSEPDQDPVYTHVKVVVVRDSDLMRFVFNKPPGDVKPKLKEFQKMVEEALPVRAPLEIYNTAYYTTNGGVIDFTKTGSCFQIDGRNRLDTDTLLNDQTNSQLLEVYKKFSVDEVERCASPLTVSSASFSDWVEVWVLIVAALIGFGAAIAACTVCCLYKKYKKSMKKQQPHLRLIDSPLNHPMGQGIPSHGGSLIMLPTGPSMHPGSERGYEWKERAMPMDTVSFNSMAH